LNTNDIVTNYIMPVLLIYTPLLSLRWQLPRLFSALMDIFAGQSSQLDLTLQTTLNRRGLLELSRTGVQRK
jgi:hypothetical protein